MTPDSGFSDFFFVLFDFIILHFQTSFFDFVFSKALSNPCDGIPLLLRFGSIDLRAESSIQIYAIDLGSPLCLRETRRKLLRPLKLEWVCPSEKCVDQCSGKERYKKK